MPYRSDTNLPPNSSVAISFIGAGTYVARATAWNRDRTVSATSTTTIEVSAPAPAPAPCINPADTADQYATYQNGMVLRYISGYVQQNNILVKTTSVTNAITVNSWYLSVIGRPGENPGWQGWIRRLDSGEPQNIVYQSFLETANSGELANYGRVVEILTFCQYQGT